MRFAQGHQKISTPLTSTHRTLRAALVNRDTEEGAEPERC